MIKHLIFISFFLASCSNENKHDEHLLFENEINWDPIPDKKKEGAFTFYPVLCDTCLEYKYAFYHLFPHEKIVINYRKPKWVDFEIDSLEFLFNDYSICKMINVNKLDSTVSITNDMINKSKANFLRVNAFNSFGVHNLDVRFFIYFEDSIISNEDGLYDIW